MRILTVLFCSLLALAAQAQMGAQAMPPPEKSETGAVTNAPADRMPADRMTVERVSTIAPSTPLPTAGVFMLITNNTGVDDRLVAVKSTASENAYLNGLTHDPATNMIVAQKIPAIDLKAGAMTVLGPAGTYVMMQSLAVPLKAGVTLPLTLVFEKAGEKTVTVDVVETGEMEKRFPPELMTADFEKIQALERKNAAKTEKPWSGRLRDRLRALAGKDPVPTGPAPMQPVPAQPVMYDSALEAARTGTVAPQEQIIQGPQTPVPPGALDRDAGSVADTPVTAQ